MSALLPRALSEMLTGPIYRHDESRSSSPFPRKGEKSRTPPRIDGP